MKNKAPLLLIEQLLMILVFALTAAFCLRGFAHSAQVSRQIQQQEQAVILAQSAAEMLKSQREMTGDSQILFYNDALEEIPASGDWRYRVVIRRETASIPGLGKASVCVDSADTPSLFSLTTGWQEVAP